MLKINDSVMWSGTWGSDIPKKAKVTGIEIGCVGKMGHTVGWTFWASIYDRNTIVSLDNGHWAYGNQISRIENETIKLNLN